MSDEESNSDIDPLVESLAGVSVKKLAKIRCSLKFKVPATTASSATSDHNEQINIEGIAETARFMGLKDVTILTAAVDRYTISQREILKRINEKFKALGVTGGKKKAKEDDVADSKFKRDYKQIIRSQQNSHYVDLLAKRPVEVVAKGYGGTNEDLKGIVEEFEELISSLEC
ncbi:hypothetical protein Tco_0031882 [Tanacetum coccineum]